MKKHTGILEKNYYRYRKELHEKGYIRYEPPIKGQRGKIFICYERIAADTHPIEGEVPPQHEGRNKLGINKDVPFSNKNDPSIEEFDKIYGGRTLSKNEMNGLEKLTLGEFEAIFSTDVISSTEEEYLRKKRRKEEE